MNARTPVPELGRMGHLVSARTVAALLKTLE